MALPRGTELLVIDSGPRTGFSAQVGPQMHSVAEQLVAVSPQIDLVDLSRLVANGSCSRQTLQSGGIFKARAVRADLAQQSRSEFGSRAGQGAEEIMIGMLCKELLNLGTIRVDLALEHAQHFTRAKAQPFLARVRAWPETNSAARAKISIRF